LFCWSDRDSQPPTLFGQGITEWTMSFAAKDNANANSIFSFHPLDPTISLNLSLTVIPPRSYFQSI
jgi:hypothetical protein